MDDKEVRIDSGLGTIHNDCTKRLQNGNISYTNRDKSYTDNISHPLGKSDTRPCAIIGPDRVLPATDSTDAYMKSIPVDPWECSDNYRYPYDSVKMADYHQNRNISPRQTFQENMQRINVAPIYSSMKNSDEPSLKNAKLNVPTEGKYCDVPYSINTLSSEHKSVRSDSAMATINPSFSRAVPPHGWPAGGGMQPLKPYPSHEYYQNSEYAASCNGPRPMPIVQPQRIVHDELHPIYHDRLYQESNIRFKPYPSSKEKFSQPRYEYVNANTFQPPSQIPLHKFDVQKPMHVNHYSMYPQGPYKYIDRRYPEPMMESYPRPPHPQSNTFHNHNIQPPYGPLPGNFYQSKPYPCPSDKSMHLNKLSYDASNKIYLELENSRTKAYPSPDSYFYNDRAKFMRGDVIVPHNTSMGGMIPQHLYRKDNSPQKGYDHLPHYRHRDHQLNLTNPLSRIPMQFSPNTIAISPCDSNTSNDTQGLGILQEDCGYASQSSTASVKSMESNISPAEYYRRQGYNYPSATLNASQNENIISRPANSSDKKGLNVRQFLQMWNEGDDENSENNNELQNNTSNYISSKTPTSNNHEQLYVLGSVTVPKEELSKYEHLQKVSKLPENIKGYNNIEILNQFEQLVESPNLHKFHNKKSSLKEYKVISKTFSKSQSKEDLRRPVSPLDVEAKISQSVIHKEVGCNFEIKPCSPKVLNVDVATPVHDILGERLIEKVANPVLMSVGRGKESKVDKSVEEAMEGTSCKLINASYSPSNSATVKPVYPLQDVLNDSNMGVCLASLPQLDNDIELNLTEVNQQFIDANKIEKSRSPHPNLLSHDNNNQITPFVKNKTKYSPNCDEQGITYSEPDKETIKLSKYRKTKKADIVANNYNIGNIVTLTQRTDSVIIKNPENLKIQNESLNSFETENTFGNNILNSEVIEPEVSNNLLSTDSIVETALDFSLSRNVPIPVDGNTENECNLPSPILIEDSDFYKNNINLSSPFKNNKQVTHSEVEYSNKNYEGSDSSPGFIQSSIEPINNKSDNCDKAQDNSKLSNKTEDEMITNTLQCIDNFYDYKSENDDKKTELERNDKYCDIEENIHSHEISIKDLDTFENKLPDLTSESILTKHSSENIYYQLNNNIKNVSGKIETEKANVPHGIETKVEEVTNLHITSNINTIEKNTQVLMSEPDCSSFIDNFGFHQLTPIKNYEDDGKVDNSNLLSKNITESNCSESNNKSIVDDTTTSILPVKESDNEIVHESPAIHSVSNSNNLNSDNFSYTVCENQKETLPVDKTTDSEAVENSSDTCNASLTVEDDIESDNKFENTIDIASTKNNVAKSSLDIACIEGVEECNKESATTVEDYLKSDDIVEKTLSTNDNLRSDSSLSADQSQSPKTCKKYFEENDSLHEDTIKNKYIKNDIDILLLNDYAGPNPGIHDKLDTNSPIVNKNDTDNIVLESDDTVQKPSCNFNEVLKTEVSVDMPVNNGKDDNEPNNQFDVIDGSCHKCDDEKFNNDSKTCSENEIILLQNHIDNACVEENNEILNNKNKDVKEPNVHDDNEFKIVNNEKRTHRKALLSPFIQKLILYNIINYKENCNLPENEVNFSNEYLSKEVESCIEDYNPDTKEKHENVLYNEFEETEEANFHIPLNEFNCEEGVILEECKEKYKLCDSSIDVATNLKRFVPLECEQNQTLRGTSPSPLTNNHKKVARRTSKRSLSDSAIERYRDDTDDQICSKRFKKYDEDFVQPQMFTTNLCNIFHSNRRNSISAIYNDVVILIDKDLILTEEEGGQKVCFTDLEAVTNLETVDADYSRESIDTIPDNLSQEDKGLWVDDIGRIETVFNDDIAEDVEISTPLSPKDSLFSNYETISNTSFMLCEEVIKNMENDVDFELNTSKYSTYSSDMSCQFPNTQINNIISSLESQNKEEIHSEVVSDSNKNIEENTVSHLEISDTLFPNTVIINDDRILDDKENLELDSNLIQESTIDLFKNKIDSHHNNDLNEKFVDCTFGLSTCNYPKYSSSPEVTSTTCEDKNPAILLKISNHKGTKVSQLENKNSTVKNTISYKLTEKKTYKNYKPNFNSSGTLITKAAQKYIPPIKISMSDLKVKLPLPKNSLDKLKQLKNSKVEPKIDKKSLKPSSLSTPRQLKKIKPKFEDVLMSIDEFQYNKPKVKNKKVRSEIPKVVIKKTETGSHYTSSRRSKDVDGHNPDLTGRKWQPWVFLEKNSFVDKMALKHKVKAIYCRRKNTYVFADKFRKYKSVYNAKFVISQPKTSDLKKGNLKYTIRLKHNN